MPPRRQNLQEYTSTSGYTAAPWCITQPRAAQTTVSELIHSEQVGRGLWTREAGRSYGFGRREHPAAVGRHCDAGEHPGRAGSHHRVFGRARHPTPGGFDRSEMDFRRIFVSNPKLAGSRIKDLHLQQRFGAVITRVRRGDMELLPRGDTLLELGDRVRVLTQRERMTRSALCLATRTARSPKLTSSTFSLGLAMGLVWEAFPCRCPAASSVKLGLGRRPLIVPSRLEPRSSHPGDDMGLRPIAPTSR